MIHGLRMVAEARGERVAKPTPGRTVMPIAPEVDPHVNDERRFAGRNGSARRFLGGNGGGGGWRADSFQDLARMRVAWMRGGGSPKGLPSSIPSTCLSHK